MMAEIKLNSINSNFKEYTLKMSDCDRIRIEMNGEYVTYMQCVNGTLAYLKSDQGDLNGFVVGHQYLYKVLRPLQ